MAVSVSTSDGPLERWIRTIVFTRLVSFLVLHLGPNKAWLMVTEVISSLCTTLFIVRLSWILLSRHVLPFHVQDFSISTFAPRTCCGDVVVWCARDKFSNCGQKCRGTVWFCIKGIRGAFRSVLSRIRRLTRSPRNVNGEEEANPSQLELPGLMVTDTVDQPTRSLDASDSLVAVPMINVMERLEKTRNDVIEEGSSTKLQDKKKW